MGPGMRQLVKFGDWSMGRGNFGGECNQWGVRRLPVPKLLIAVLLFVLLLLQ